MSGPASQLSQRLSANAEAVCRAYLPKGRRSGAYWTCGDVMERKGRSLFVRLSGDRAANFANMLRCRLCCGASSWGLSTDGWTASTQHNFHTRFCRHGCVSINMEVQSCLKKSSFPELRKNIERHRLSSSGNDISFISRRPAQTTDLAEMRQRSIELGAPPEAERRRQSACFRDRCRGRDLVAAEGTKVQPAGVAQARTLFVSRAVRWLRFLGWLDEAVERAIPMAPSSMSMKHGCAASADCPKQRFETICDAADEFFDWLAASGTPLASVRIADIDGAIAAKKARGTCDRRTMHDYAQRLRAFFRFAETRGWCMPGMAEGIMPPRFKPDEAVPKGLKREDVLRLLASTESNRPADTRDRAILMLFIAYGLRAGEVGGLR